MAYGANTAGGYLAGLTPEESRMRTLAAAFTQRGMDPQIQVGGWGGLAQGIGGLAQALAGRSIASQADKKQAETTDKVRQQIAAMGLDPKLGAVANSLLDTGDARGALEFSASALTSPQAESWRVLSDDEEKAMGLDTSGSYKANNAGQVDVLIKPRESNLLTPEEFNQKAQLAALGRAPGAPKPPPSLTERVWETLINGDPNSPEYGLAYQEATKPQAQTGVNEQGQQIVTYITPELPPNIRRPSYMQAAAPQAAPTAEVAAAPGASGPRPGDFTAPAQPASGVPGFSTSAPIVTGVSSKRDQPLTEDQRKNRQLYERASQQLPIVENNFDAMTQIGNQAGAMLPQAMSGYTTSEQYQRAANALTDIAASYLYSVSGATANPGEVANLAKTLIPVPGESAGSLADKKARVKQMVESIKQRASNGADSTAPATPDNDPLGIR